MDYNSYDICREILEYYDLAEYTEWIGESDIDSYLDEYYPEMESDDRWFVHDRMEKFVDYIDRWRSVTDEEDEYNE